MAAGRFLTKRCVSPSCYCYTHTHTHTHTHIHTQTHTHDHPVTVVSALPAPSQFDSPVSLALGCDRLQPHISSRQLEGSGAGDEPCSSEGSQLTDAVGIWGPEPRSPRAVPSPPTPLSLQNVNSVTCSESLELRSYPPACQKDHTLPWIDLVLSHCFAYRARTFPIELMLIIQKQFLI